MLVRAQLVHVALFSTIYLRENYVAFDHSIEGNEVKSNLPLQMASYYNIIFIPVWVIVLTIFLLDNYKKFGKLTQIIIVTVVIAIFIIEILRLYMAYEGNLNDKIPELAGFWMLSVFLQLPLQGLLLFNPYFQLHILEIVCQSVIFILLVVQIMSGYVALRYTASQQAIYYKIMKLKSERSSYNMQVRSTTDFKEK